MSKMRKCAAIANYDDDVEAVHVSFEECSISIIDVMIPY